jgi:hypothetical protein
MTSTIKVNKIEKESGSTLTLGGPSTAVTLACGATQTGFGRTGTVDWCTTAKTSPFAAVSGDGFFVNTTCGAVTVTLPSSPSQGDIVAFKDYAGTWDSNGLTICRNGSKINGACFNATLGTQGQSITLIYVDGTKGWQDIQDSTSDVTGASFISATGGVITTSGSFKIHTFNSSGTFCVSSLSPVSANNEVSYMVVAGGGSGAPSQGCVGTSGGGAGGFREGKSSVDSYTASPIVAPAGITVTVQGYPITVGAGGTAGAVSTPQSKGVNGSNSTFSTITSAGGGFGAGGGNPSAGASFSGGPGGSGGGGGTCLNAGNSADPAGTGNTPPVSPAQGTNGGTGAACGSYNGGGGGGATVAGTNGTQPGGCGGAGATTEITASPVAYAGGGGGGNSPSFASSGGTGGGANGATRSSGAVANAGTANKGGGGAGSSGTPSNTAGGLGGSGVVVIRYKYQ